MWDYIQTAIGAGLGIAGSLIVFGTGPLGWTIGITGAISMFIAGFAIGYNEKKLREDIESRFGEIALTVDEIQNYANSLTNSNLALQLNLYIDEQENAEKLKKQVESSLTQLQSYNFKLGLGLSIDENSYKAAIEQYILNATEYLTQKQVVSSMSVDIIYDKSTTGERLTTFAATFYGDNQAKLTELGNKLKNTIETGFVDGAWIGDKQQEAIDLQKEIQEILDYVSEIEYKAKLKSIELDVANLDMDKDSFKGILKQAEETIQEQIENLEGVRLEAIKVAQMEFDQNILNGMAKDSAKQIYDSAVKEAQEKFEAGKLELNYGTVDFGLNVIQEKYAVELEKASVVWGTTTRNAWEQGYMYGARNPEEIYERPIQDIVMGMQKTYDLNLRGMDISSAARKNIADLVEQLQPSKEDYQEIADAAIKAGETVPEYVTKGLSDIAKLEAISGSLEAQSYLIGEKLSTDVSFLNLLATAQNAGEQINDETARGLMANLTVVENAADGTITLINDTIGEKTFDITPELVKNMTDLGVSLSDGLLAGASGEQEKNKKKWYEWSIFPWNWFKQKNEINSPSKLFTRGGEDIMQGLWNGLKNIWDKITGWWKGLSFPELDFKMPHFSWTTTPANGWMADILGAIGLPLSLPKLNVSWYANGGFPGVGEMFIAREAGPELVGSIGRKTAVANNDQIISGIESGVYRAMIAANSTNRGGTQIIRITNEIDGDVVGEKVIRYHNGVVMQTGESPLLV
jgi:hypothetical protein